MLSRECCEQLCSKKLREVKTAVDELCVKDATDFLMYCLKYKEEWVQSICNVINQRYDVITVCLADGRGAALLDYNNPRFEEGVEGTCQIGKYEADGGGRIDYRFVYKLGEKLSLDDLIEDCLEFAELKSDDYSVMCGRSETRESSVFQKAQ